MNYSININQFAIVENGLNIDIIDAAIFDYFSRFYASPKAVSMLEGTTKYVLIRWDKLIENMPMIGVKSRRGVIDRLSNLCEAGLIERHPDNKKMGASWFCAGDKYDLMYAAKRTGARQTAQGCDPDCTGDDANLHRGVNETAHDIKVSLEPSPLEPLSLEPSPISENEFSQEIPVVENENLKPEPEIKIESVKDKKNQKEKSSAQKEKGDPFYIPTLESFGMYYTIWSKAKTGNSDGDKFVWNPKECGQLKNFITALKKACVDQGNSAAIQTPEIFKEQVLRPYFETYIKISLEQEFYLQQFTPTFMYSKFNEIIIKIKSYVTTGKINGRTVESVKQSITEQQRAADREFIANTRW